MVETSFTKYEIKEINDDGSEKLSECVIVEHPVDNLKIENLMELEEDDEEIKNIIPTDLLAIKYEVTASPSQNVEHQNVFKFGSLSPLKLIPKKLKQHPRTKDFGKFKCDLCSRIFSYHRSFRQHRLLHKNATLEVQCAICHKMIKPAALDYHMKYKHITERKFQCRKCGRHFKSPGSLRHHETSQHGEHDYFQFECTKCNHFFESTSFLEAHIKQFHLPVIVEIVECEHCKKVFENSSQLRLHVGVLGKCRNTLKV